MTTIYKFKKIKILMLAALLAGVTSCETDFTNPNAATEQQVYTSRAGLFAASVGLQQLYANTGIRWIVESPAITTREGGITTTYQNMIELEEGGEALPNFNSNVVGLWSTMLRVNRFSTEIYDNADNLDINAGTVSNIKAFALLHRAMAIGTLAQNYEQVIVETNQDNNATFVNRIDAYKYAVGLLNDAIAELSSNPLTQEFQDNVNINAIDLINATKAFKARYSLFAGDYDEAIAAAQNVSLSSVSMLNYDSQNRNPIWGRVFLNNSPTFKPQDNFGLPSEFTFNANDGRISFYLENVDETNQNGYAIDNLKGFYDNETKSIPLYIPDEMNLIIAEANVRKSNPDLSAAVDALNNVLTDVDDPLGINANTDAYSGDMNANAILKEIYKNRRAELFLTGLSLEDSRRFNRPEPSGTSQNYSEERNRNFYPYPDIERNSNPNTPADPSK